MDLATGALGSLLPKLAELLADEYNRLKGLRKDVEFLERELRSMHAALRKVAEVPRDQLDEQVRLWANEVRELSYNMEDVVDRFLVRVEGPDDPVKSSRKLKRLMKKMADLFTVGSTRHQIAHAIEDIKGQIEDVAARQDRYKIDDIVANPTATTTVDPRLLSLYKDQKEIVGIQEASVDLINRLAIQKGDASMQHLKILSIFGFGGLGKTTLAKAVYDGIKEQFECIAFVLVGQNPDLKKLVKNILFELDKQKYMSFSKAMLDERRLIDQLRGLLHNKRYFIVIDDMWDTPTWEIVKCAFVDSNRGSRIVTTTRIFEVVATANDVYKMEPLSDENSEELFRKRISSTACASYRRLQFYGRPFYQLENLGRLHQLRYLGLGDTPIYELPKEIGGLRFLQTIDLWGNKIEALPQSVFLLRQLKCLRLCAGSVMSSISVPDGMGNLTSLEELSLFNVNKSPNFVKELGKLPELRKLHIDCIELPESWMCKSMVESLGNLQKIQVLYLYSSSAKFDLEGYMPPPQLRYLTLWTASIRLPTWINSSLLPNLVHLLICLRDAMEAHDLVTLGGLPELLGLGIYGCEDGIPVVMGDDAFPKLKSCVMVAPLKFLPGAMPRLERIELSVHVRALKEANFDLDFGSLENLPCLRVVTVHIYVHNTTATEVDEVEAAVRHAVDIHPNHPILELRRWGQGVEEEDKEKEEDDDDTHTDKEGQGR